MATTKDPKPKVTKTKATATKAKATKPKVTKAKATKAKAKPVPVPIDLGQELYDVVSKTSFKVRANETAETFKIKGSPYLTKKLRTHFNNIQADKMVTVRRLCFLTRMFGKQIKIKKDGVVREF